MIFVRREKVKEPAVLRSRLVKNLKAKAALYFAKKETKRGQRGRWFTIGHGKTRETVGLPGTGLSYTQEQRLGASRADEPGRLSEPPSSVAGSDVESAPSSGESRALIWLVLLVLVAVVVAIWVSARVFLSPTA
jgi:hypothetical protein